MIYALEQMVHIQNAIAAALNHLDLVVERGNGGRCYIMKLCQIFAYNF